MRGGFVNPDKFEPFQTRIQVVSKFLNRLLLMTERTLETPPPAVVFLLFFSFATAAALLFQKFFLPIVTSVHYGQGLVEGDSAYFHAIAVELAERIAPGKLTPAQVDILTSRVRYSTERICGALGYNDVMKLDDALCELVAVWQGRAA
ncbi:MAG: hypothetical protein CVU17_11170 [Betaproteobacteria bacterium HGW-Betaproteobacteria-11]|nr:MAG: hypothetical protein CVU17_11170 [Betaproteobacteria bacterium HGW-Betaproteobacteria-11]